MFENPETEIERLRRARAVGQGNIEDGNGGARERWRRRGVIASAGMEDGGQAFVMPVLVVGVVVQAVVEFGRSGEDESEEEARERRGDDGGAKPSGSKKSQECPPGMAASMRGVGWSAQSHNSEVNPLSI